MDELNITFSDEDWQWILETAKREGMSPNEVVQAVIQLGRDPGLGTIIPLLRPCDN